MAVTSGDAGTAESPEGPRPRVNRRAEVVQAAFELFSERGYRGGSLDQVAKRAGLTKAGLLHYFSSKEELLIAVLAERDRGTGELRERTTQPDAGFRGRLEALRAVVEQNTHQPGLVQVFTVLAAESVTDDHPAQAFFRERYRIARERMSSLFTTEGADGRVVASLVIAAMDGLQLQWLLDPDEVDMVEAFALLTSLLETLG